MSRTREAGFVIATVAGTTVGALLLREHLAATNLAMLYLLAVMAVATRCSRRMAVAASFLSVATFDFFCVPPYYTFRVADYEYGVTFGVMLAVALVISAQTSKLRTLAADARLRARRTDALYRLSRGLAEESQILDMARKAASLAEEVFGMRTTILLPHEGRITADSQVYAHPAPPPVDLEIAQWVLDHQEKSAGDMAKEASGLYLPLRGGTGTVGVMCVTLEGKGSALPEEQQQLLEVFAHQTALAIERTLSDRAAADSQLRMESEQMRSSLLSAVSHDLRTPLATITGSASTLRLQGIRLDEKTRHELLDSISSEAERLARLVANLLDMTRFERGNIELRRDLYPLEEIVGSVLQRMDGPLEGREVTTDIPESLPLVSVDDVLMGQVLWNLLENALKYTPPGSPIDVVARATRDAVLLEVRDRGPGLQPCEQEKIFEKFYRGGTHVAQGAGLGLPICRAIVQAHKGQITAFNRPGGGAVFQVRLPREHAG